MGEEEEREEERERKTTMKPWEQHSAVISIPRFDYKAPSSLLLHSHSAFLITCPIKREKSATKEAMTIFEKMIMSYYTGTSECNEKSDAINAAKRRKVECDVELGVDCSVTESNNDANSAETIEKSCSPTSKSDTNSGTRYNLSLVKLTRSGLLLFTVPKNDFPDVTDIVSNIFRSLELGQLSSPSIFDKFVCHVLPHIPLVDEANNSVTLLLLYVSWQGTLNEHMYEIIFRWCHRIFPIQATCCLIEKELQTVLSKLVRQFVSDHQDKLQRPIKFAIGYNRRGIEETEMKTSRKSSNESEDLALLDRNKCFSVVAATIKDIIPDSVVDLRSPELSVLVEVLPISGISNGSLVVGVAVLPHNLVSTKPKLSIKALLSDSKTKNGKQK